MTSITGLRPLLQFPKAGKFYLLNSPLPVTEVDALFAHAIAEQDKLNPIPTPRGIVFGPVGSNSPQQVGCRCRQRFMLASSSMIVIKLDMMAPNNGSESTFLQNPAAPIDVSQRWMVLQRSPRLVGQEQLENAGGTKEQDMSETS